MKYLVVILVFLISCGKNAEKQTVENFDLEKLDVYNNDDINAFINSFLSNYQPDKDGNLSDILVRSKFIGNKLRKDSLILNEDNLRMISKKELDSLISKEDWIFITKQINDKKEYQIDKKYFILKILDSDSLKKENENFTNETEKKFNSLKKINIDSALEYMKLRDIENYSFVKKFTPILNIDKPLFTIDKKLVIFSYSTYSGSLDAFSETAIYQFKNKKWIKVKSVRMMIS